MKPCNPKQLVAAVCRVHAPVFSFFAWTKTKPSIETKDQIYLISDLISHWLSIGLLSKIRLFAVRELTENLQRNRIRFRPDNEISHIAKIVMYIKCSVSIEVSTDKRLQKGGYFSSIRSKWLANQQTCVSVINYSVINVCRRRIIARECKRVESEELRRTAVDVNRRLFRSAAWWISFVPARGTRTCKSAFI